MIFNWNYLDFERDRVTAQMTGQTYFESGNIRIYMLLPRRFKSIYTRIYVFLNRNWRVEVQSTCFYYFEVIISKYSLSLPRILGSSGITRYSVYSQIFKYRTCYSTCSRNNSSSCQSISMN